MAKKPSTRSVPALPVEIIEKKIFLIRDQKVMLDSDLAELYGVETKVLNQAVRRNLRRFPDDFMFRITQEEFDILRSQFVTSSWGGRRTKPHAFTEQGVAMLSSVLKSVRAMEVNIQIMRTFVNLRQILSTHKDLARKLAELEKQYAEHDRKFQLVFDAIRQLMEPPPSPKKRRIGFHSPQD